MEENDGRIIESNKKRVKMKICFLTHNINQDNGAGVFSSRLINGLKEQFGIGHEIFVYPIKFLKLRRAVKSCDAVHALDVWPYAVLGYLASRGLKKKFIITAVGSGAILPLYNFWQAPVAKFIYKRADEVIAVSNFTKREILKKVPNLKISVITHGVDFEKFSARNLADGNSRRGRAGANINEFKIESDKGIRNFQAQGFGQNKPYILSVGSLRWRKGYHRSIPAFAEVSKIFPDLKYVIVGKRYKDVYYERMEKLIRDFSLEGKVVILDNIDDENVLIRLYQNAELFCLASQTANRDLEGFGLVFLESAAAGLPVVGTSGSGTEDAVAAGPPAGRAEKNGILIPDPRDSKVFADAVIKILSDANLKRSMSQASLAWARGFSWESKIAQYKNLYFRNFLA